MSFPSKEARQVCYTARDELWKCLDANDENVKACMEYRKHFEKNCSALWVKHFDKKRKYEKFKDNMESIDWFIPSEEKSE